MRYYFAPLEGITDSFFRSLHSKYFPGVDRYYTPFLSPCQVERLHAPRLGFLSIALDFFGKLWYNIDIPFFW